MQSCLLYGYLNLIKTSISVFVKTSVFLPALLSPKVPSIVTGVKNDASVFPKVSTSGPNPIEAKFQLASLMVPSRVNVQRPNGPTLVYAAGLSISGMDAFIHIVFPSESYMVVMEEVHSLVFVYTEGNSTQIEEKSDLLLEGIK